EAAPGGPGAKTAPPQAHPPVTRRASGTIARTASTDARNAGARIAHSDPPAVTYSARKDQRNSGGAACSHRSGPVSSANDLSNMLTRTNASSYQYDGAAR